jgi:hypothetical protein
MATDNSPEQILVEFLQANGEPVKLGDLGAEFMTVNNIAATNAPLPFRVKVQKKTSKAANAFYDYAQNGVPLPDGLNTFVRVEGAIIAMGRTRPSKTGYPTREGTAQVIIGGLAYKATAYLTESKTPFYIKVVATKVPDTTAAMKKAQQVPKGGSIVF